MSTKERVNLYLMVLYNHLFQTLLIQLYVFKVKLL